MPTPQAGPRDLLVRVKAVSVNPVDTKVLGSAKPAAGQFDAANLTRAHAFIESGKAQGKVVLEGF